MILEEIKLIHFRNYETLQLEIHPLLNIFVGENAQGKTNIIEAIYMCAMGKSFRNSKDQEMILFDKGQAYIKIKLQRINGKSDIEIKLSQEERKKMRVNGIQLEKGGELLGNLNVVTFTPDDLKIIKGSPIERRKFIDNEISQIIPRYYYNLLQYNRILMHRNKLLKSFKGKKIDLEIWNDQLVNIGSWIINTRIRFIKRISILAKLMHRKITDEKESLEILYSCSLPLKEKEENISLKEVFYKKLIETEEEERRRGTTLIGPHRDDLILKVNGMDVKNYGSQGQQRTSVLSLKMAELELIKGEVGEYPILLLDDVMSELDVKRQFYLLNNLKNIQTFITTTQTEQLSIEKINNKRIFNVNKGKVRIYD
ncbi:DNA replication/repair protein RecF [Alkaliphilus serpentinus]|uniref:DNA replication and repair protein RecF n=1 Tax=Alkaliphilus serpentinus TaxID=1482731 RepID=A0A833M933_9FIRM|nr:DNA replication/repair protein RecF [Alkaliphilus serpentinus]KAB3532224.1 DNA replication/repair protein RecF [Alkaliphilus serpentinus]